MHVIIDGPVIEPKKKSFFRREKIAKVTDNAFLAFAVLVAVDYLYNFGKDLYQMYHKVYPPPYLIVLHAAIVVIYIGGIIPGLIKSRRLKKELKIAQVTEALDRNSDMSTGFYASTTMAGASFTATTGSIPPNSTTFTWPPKQP